MLSVEIGIAVVLALVTLYFAVLLPLMKKVCDEPYAH
jgi:hypothetical protein